MNRAQDDLPLSGPGRLHPDDDPACGTPVLQDALALLLQDPALDHRRCGEPLPAAWIARLFDYLHALYGERPATLPASDDERAWLAWRERLGAIPSAGLRRGIPKLLRRASPPSLQDIVRLCLPQIEPHAAYLEAVKGIHAREQGLPGHWSDPAVYWASVAVGAFDLKSKTYAQLKHQWEAALAAELASPHDGPIPPPPGRAEDCAAAPPPAAARRMVGNLRAAMSTSAREPRDHKRWARRIQSRLADGDDSVTELQAEAARQALDP